MSSFNTPWSNNDNLTPFIEKRKQYQDQYNLGRWINQLLNCYSFRTTKHPYSLHMVFNKEGKGEIIIWDRIFSRIDIKSVDREKTKSYLKKYIANLDETFLIQVFGQKKWTQDRDSYIIDFLKYVVKEHAQDMAKSENLEVSWIHDKENEAILNKLYNDSYRQKEILRDRNDKSIELTEAWKKYYSHILQDAYAYYNNTKYLWRMWENLVFPEDCMSNIRHKLKNSQTLSMIEIADFIKYLTHSEILDEQENKSYNHIKWVKKLMINQLRKMLYVEQKYNYYKLHTILEGFKNEAHNINNITSTKTNIPQESIHTDINLKSLSSAANKQLRRSDMQDRTRARVRVQNTSDLNPKNISTIFDTHIEQLQQHYNKSKHKVNISKIELANKFKTIPIHESEIKEMTDYLKTFENTKSHNNIWKKKLLPRLKKKYEWDRDPYLKQLFETDSKKTGWNGTYEDIKIRMDYTLEDEHGNITEYPGWYECMIVPMDSKNESWLSDHDIILDPKKTIVNMIRVKSSIGIDEFFELVSGWIDSAIKTLFQWQDMLTSTTRDPTWPPRYLIETQFHLKNIIPQEFLDNNMKNKDITYISIDQNPKFKRQVEKNIIIYILKEVFESWIANRYIYDNDTHHLFDRIRKWITENWYFETDGFEMFLNAAIDNESDRNKFRICGMGSHNISCSLINNTLSSNGIIGIKRDNKLKFFPVSLIAWIFNDTLHHHNSFDKLKRETITELHETFVNSNKKTSS